MGTVRKLLNCILVGTLVVACATPVMADDIQVTLNGETLAFDVKPQIINDRTMVPLRAIFEALGAVVDWNQDTKTITSQKADRKVILGIGEKTMLVNDNTVEIDTPAQIVEDRTLVPVRAIAEAYDADVTWNADTKTVVIVDNTPNATVTPTPEKQAEYEYKAKTVAYYQGGGNLPRYDSVVDCGKEIKFDELESVYYYKYTSDEDIQTYIEVAKLKGFNEFKEGDKVILARKPLDYISIEKVDDTVKVKAKVLESYRNTDFVRIEELIAEAEFQSDKTQDGKNVDVNKTCNPEWYTYVKDKSEYRYDTYYYNSDLTLDSIKDALERYNALYDCYRIESMNAGLRLCVYLKDNEEYAMRMLTSTEYHYSKKYRKYGSFPCTIIRVVHPK